MIGTLPDSLTIGEKDYKVRTDYRDVLQVFEAFSDPELDSFHKSIVAVYLLLSDFSNAEDVYTAIDCGFPMEEAINQIVWFISAGNPRDKEEKLPVYDWEQDEQMIFSSVNKVAAREIRELPYLHWWTFLGYFNEIGEGIFSYVVGIRKKMNEGKKLDNEEKEFFKKNRDMVKIKPHLTEKEQKEEDEFQSLLNEVLG